MSKFPARTIIELLLFGLFLALCFSRPAAPAETAAPPELSISTPPMAAVGVLKCGHIVAVWIFLSNGKMARITADGTQFNAALEAWLQSGKHNFIDTCGPTT